MSDGAGSTQTVVLHAFLPVRLGLTLALGVPWAVFVWLAVSLADDQTAAVAILALVLAVVALVWFRIVFAKVVLHPEHLVVRNYLRTRRIPRADIVDFRVHNPQSAAPNTTKLVARLRDGREVRLNIGSLSFLLTTTRWLDDAAATLSVWNANGVVSSSRDGTPPSTRRRR